VLRWARWQIGSRLAPGPIVVPFVGATVLVVERGMTGATGNVYCGLHEFEQMAFVLHYLRPGDLFLDVGANVGSYTILAAGAAGADAVAYEPVRETWARLVRNVRANALEDRARCVRSAVGEQSGTATMTRGRDSMNQIVSDVSPTDDVESVPLISLDETVEAPVTGHLVAKVDVEGHEPLVFAGAGRLLSAGVFSALVVEHWGPPPACLAGMQACR